MNSRSFAHFTRWLNLPTGVLLALLQRSPAVKVVAAVGEYIVASPVGALLKGTIAAAASLGAVNSLAGATTLETSPVSPSPLAATVGTPVSVRFSILGTSSSPEVWRIVGNVPAGLALYTTAAGTAGGITSGDLNGAVIYLRGTPTTAGSGTITIRAIDTPTGSQSPLFTYVVNVTGAVATPPAITTQPASQSVTVGGNVTFSVTATGTDLTYQWSKDGVAIAGATAASLSLASVQASAAGGYTVVVTNGSGSVTSTAATLTVTPAGPPPVGSSVGHIVNMSARATAALGDGTLIVGFVVSAGNGTKPLLIRGVGPTLQGFSVPGFLADPSMTLFNAGGTPLNSNDNWATDPLVTPALLSQVGAFPFASATSRDAAMVFSVAGGSRYTAHVLTSAGSGVALAEFYDAAPVYADGDPRLVNISARAQVGTGADVLIAGFIIGGATPVRVLIRAAGPDLTPFGVGGVLANPTLTLRTLPGNVIVQENDNLGAAANIADIQAASGAVGAFPIPTTSLSAAMLVTLQPGAYTAVVSGANTTTGVALVEVYEVP